MARDVIVRKYADIPRNYEWYRSASSLDEAKFLAMVHPSEKIYIIKAAKDNYSMYRKREV